MILAVVSMLPSFSEANAYKLATLNGQMNDLSSCILTEKAEKFIIILGTAYDVML